MNETMQVVSHGTFIQTSPTKHKCLLTVHFPFLSLDLSFLVFFFADDACAPPSSADTEAAADGFDEPVPSSPDAEDEDDVEDALEEGGALAALRLGLPEPLALPFEAVEVPPMLVISC
jgi:hypothetical protein